MFRFHLISALFFCVIPEKVLVGGLLMPQLLVMRILPCFFMIPWVSPCSLSTMLGQERAPKRMPADKGITRGLCLNECKGVLSPLFIFVMARCLYIDQTIPSPTHSHWIVQGHRSLTSFYGTQSKEILCIPPSLCALKGTTLLHLLKILLETITWNQHILPFLMQPQPNYRMLLLTERR